MGKFSAEFRNENWKFALFPLLLVEEENTFVWRSNTVRGISYQRLDTFVFMRSVERMVTSGFSVGFFCISTRSE